MSHVRAHLRMMTNEEVGEFVATLNRDGTTDKYILEDFTGEYRVSARSLIGAIYMAVDHNNDTYLVNETNDGVFPNSIDKFRALAAVD